MSDRDETNPSTQADSPLWTNPASDEELFAHLVAPDNLAEIVAQIVAESAQRLAERLKPYNTKVRTIDLLRDLD
ncbi:hypothetical protein LCGC14_0920110 [marine sediment metagenome]|uniref:Uncharacterized protein n=1 Tax=marine sediment metagenome TaxID=412755 RepID=A0A0F9R9S5_9ZZZZ